MVFQKYLIIFQQFKSNYAYKKNFKFDGFIYKKKMIVLTIKNKNKKKEKVGLVLNGRYC